MELYKHTQNIKTYIARAAVQEITRLPIKVPSNGWQNVGLHVKMKL